jgi:hypothetical protein
VWAWISIAVVVAFVALIRLRLADLPLERDEGEYAYIAQLMLQGVPPYAIAYNMKLPGTYGAYAVILALLGQTPAAVHRGLLIVNALTIVLIYLLGNHLFGRLAGIVASASYGLLAVCPSVQGVAAHSTHFVLVPALLGLFVLLVDIEHGKTRTYFCSGALTGLAFVMKQQGLVFVVFAALFLLWNGWRNRAVTRREMLTGVAVLVAGALLPFLLTGLIVYWSGVFQRFWFWTFSYAWEYATPASLSDGIDMFLKRAPRAVGSTVPIWLLAGVGVVLLWWVRAKQGHAVFVVGLLAFSFIGVCPGFLFRGHYFILMLPAVAVLAGLAVSSIRRRMLDHPRWSTWAPVPVLAFLGCCSYVVIQEKSIFFELDPQMVSRVIYGANPFPEALTIGRYINEHSDSAAKIAVLGSEPEIFFYARRRSATGYLYTYPLLENQRYANRMQQEMIAEIDAAHPEYVVSVAVPASWTEGPSSERLILEWAEQFVGRSYELEGVIDIVSMDRTEYRWGDDARRYTPRSKYRLQVFKRKERPTTSPHAPTLVPRAIRERTYGSGNSISFQRLPDPRSPGSTQIERHEALTLRLQSPARSTLALALATGQGTPGHSR